jgi:prepilin-type N-terminal cleavage/methylation domain-containing protein
MRSNGRQRGFTLLELMATLVVGSIVLGIGVPALSAFKVRMQVRGALGTSRRRWRLPG